MVVNKKHLSLNPLKSTTPFLISENAILPPFCSFPRFWIFIVFFFYFPILPTFPLNPFRSGAADLYQDETS